MADYDSAMRAAAEEAMIEMSREFPVCQHENKLIIGDWNGPAREHAAKLHTESLLQAAREYRALNPMTDEERSVQARSFAYGNVALHNADVTREMVDDEARKLE